MTDPGWLEPLDPPIKVLAGALLASVLADDHNPYWMVLTYYWLCIRSRLR